MQIKHAPTFELPPDIPYDAFGRTGKFGKLFPFIRPWHWKGSINPVSFFKNLGDSKFLFSSNGVDDDNPNIPAAYTYFGQFLSHDLSFDPTSIGERKTDPAMEWNFRSAAFDLDMIYGGGIFMSPHLYEKDIPVFIMGKSSSSSPPFQDFWDLQRNIQGSPIIPDNRNNDNVMVSQLHVALQLLHNRFVHAFMQDNNYTPAQIFTGARHETIRHYQWVILHDYLPTLICPKVYASVLKNKARTYSTSRLPRWKKLLSFFFINNPVFDKREWVRSIFHTRDHPYIPVEFSAAAFRFGHSQVASTYQFNQDTFGAIMPDPDQKKPVFFVDWSLFFNKQNLSHQINTNFSSAFEREVNIHGEGFKLAALDFLRGWKLNLPSGQDVARKMGVRELSKSDWKKLDAQFKEFPYKKLQQHFQQHTPLWYYILAEAQSQAEGMRLGPLGSHLVAETIIGILYADPTSFLNIEPDWKPDKVKTGQSEEFTLEDLLEMAGVLYGAKIPTLTKPLNVPPPPPDKPWPPALPPRLASSVHCLLSDSGLPSSD